MSGSQGAAARGELAGPQAMLTGDEPMTNALVRTSPMSSATISAPGSPSRTRLDAKDQMVVEGKQERASDDAAPVISILYSPGSPLPRLSKYIEQIVELRVAAKFITTKNKEIHIRSLWGTDVYTDDSDVVAICQHTGKLILRSTPPSKLVGIGVFLRVLPGRSHYQSTTRYKLRSRNWVSTYGKCSLELVRLEYINQADRLDPRTPGSNLRAVVTNSAPMSKRTYDRKRFVPNSGIVFNRCNEPCLKYCLALVSDRGTDSELWTSTRLKREVIYLDSPKGQYELKRTGNLRGHDVYQWAIVNVPSSHSTVSRPVPAPAEETHVLASDIDWAEIRWGIESVIVRDQTFKVHTIRFRPIQQ